MYYAQFPIQQYLLLCNKAICIQFLYYMGAHAILETRSEVTFLRKLFSGHKRNRIFQRYRLFILSDQNGKWLRTWLYDWIVSYESEKKTWCWLIWFVASTYVESDVNASVGNGNNDHRIVIINLNFYIKAQFSRRLLFVLIRFNFIISSIF